MKENRLQKGGSLSRATERITDEERREARGWGVEKLSVEKHRGGEGMREKSLEKRSR